MASRRTATFRFLDLPPQLRNRIYELILVKETAIELKTDFDNYNRPGQLSDYSPTGAAIDNTPRDIETSVRQPNLSKLCKEIRAEALSVFYGQNVFLFEHWRILGPDDIVVGWLNALGYANRRMLKHF